MDFPSPLLLKTAMTEALKLARLAHGKTSPNPMVGAVVLSENGETLGQGYHVKAGAPHAEVIAIREALEKIGKETPDLSKATLVVTLEPCGHFGKTPPCVDLVLSSQIRRVVVGCADPNPLMQGKSIAKLRSQGVAVVFGAEAVGLELEQECQKLIRGFRSILEKKHPFVTLKCAVSLDGKIATAGGESQWITGEAARQAGHVERSEHDTILAGVGTILSDNPRLNVRVESEKSEASAQTPKKSIRKVILDSRLRTPPDSKIFESGDEVLIYCDANYPQDRRENLEKAGALVIPVGVTVSSGTPHPGAPAPAQASTPVFSHESVNLKEVLEDLARRGSQEVLVEGGARILGAFVREKCFDRVLYFVAPKILGSESRDVFEGVGIQNLSESVTLSDISARLIGKDLVIEGVRSCSPA